MLFKLSNSIEINFTGEKSVCCIFQQIIQYCFFLFLDCKTNKNFPLLCFLASFEIYCFDVRILLFFFSIFFLVCQFIISIFFSSLGGMKCMFFPLISSFYKQFCFHNLLLLLFSLSCESQLHCIKFEVLSEQKRFSFV